MRGRIRVASTGEGSSVPWRELEGPELWARVEVVEPRGVRVHVRVGGMESSEELSLASTLLVAAIED